MLALLLYSGGSKVIPKFVPNIGGTRHRRKKKHELIEVTEAGQLPRIFRSKFVPPKVSIAESIDMELLALLLEDEWN